jgi:hypothetical protein
MRSVPVRVMYAVAMITSSTRIPATSTIVLPRLKSECVANDALFEFDHRVLFMFVLLIPRRACFVLANNGLTAWAD